MRLIESQMVMPECAAPMEAYDRYYFFPKPGVFSRPVVEGAFRKRMPWHRTPGDAMATSSIPGAYVTTSEGAPHMNDGGCAFVTVVFDLTERKLIKLKREGVMGQLTIDYLRDSGSAVMGDPDACIAAAKRYEAVGCDLLLCLVNPYKIPHEKVMQTIELMGKHVLPEFA